MTNLEINSGSREFAVKEGLNYVKAAMKKMSDDNLSQGSVDTSVDTQLKYATLEASIQHFKDFGKSSQVPSPLKPLQLNPKKDKEKRSFLYVQLPLLEGGLICPYVKLGYFTMAVTDDVWTKVHQTLRRYATSCNQFFIELIPVSESVKVTSSIYFFVTILISMLMLNQLLQGSKIEAWLLKTFSVDKYRPKGNGLDDMRDGKLKSFLKGRVNQDIEDFYRGKHGIKGNEVKHEQIRLKVSFYIGIYADYLSILTSCVV